MSVLSYVLFKVASGTEREVAQKMIEFEEVIEADVVFGEYDVIARMTTSRSGKATGFCFRQSENCTECSCDINDDNFKRIQGKNLSRPKKIIS